MSGVDVWDVLSEEQKMDVNDLGVNFGGKVSGVHFLGVRDQEVTVWTSKLP